MARTHNILLAEMLRLEATAATTEKPEAEETDIFGKYLFAPERWYEGDDIPSPPEKNTKEEDKLKSQLKQHYEGDMEKLTPATINKLVKLKNSFSRMRNILHLSPCFLGFFHSGYVGRLRCAIRLTCL